LVELAALSDPTLLPQAVASALDVHEQPARPLIQTLIDFLRSRELLLVLDNCEHLAGACAHFTNSVLQACPKLSILVTSREVLEIDGEQVLLVPPLAAPNPAHLPPLPELSQYDAVRLFVESSTRIQSQFALTGDNALAITQICYRLDGIPLAIELATRVSHVTTQHIADQLDQRFRLLTGGVRTALPQHKTLRATMDWSHSLLSRPERILFRRLSVFAGGWSCDAAEAVCADESLAAAAVPDVLTQLVHKSLIVIIEPVRYQMLETIREYAAEQLSTSGELGQTQSRHAQYFLTLATSGQTHLRGAEQLVWAKRFELEYNNLRTVLYWAQEHGQIEVGASLAAALTWFWEFYGYLREGRQWLEITLNALASHSDSMPLRAGALYALGVLASRQTDFVLAALCLEESLVLWQTLGDQPNTAEVTLYLGIVALTAGDIDQAIVRCTECITLFRKLGNPWSEALSMSNLGMATLVQGDLAQARVLFDTALAQLQAVGDQFFTGTILLSKGFLHALEGDHERAQETAYRAFQLINAAGDKLYLNYSIVLMANIAAARSLPQRAVRLLGISAMLTEVFGIPLPPLVQSIAGQAMAAAQSQLAESLFETVQAEGRAMTFEQAIEYALDLNDR
jgi:predicted ATPase